jgi:hypothetical protein
MKIDKLVSFLVYCSFFGLSLIFSRSCFFNIFEIFKKLNRVDFLMKRQNPSKFTNHDDGQCSKIRRKEEIRPHRFRRIFKFWKKISKIQPKRTGDDGGTVKIRKTEMRPVSTLNRLFPPKNRRCDFRTKFIKNRTIFAKIGK